jgi:hypothetical protein
LGGQKETKSFVLKGVLHLTGFRLYKIFSVVGFFFTLHTNLFFLKNNTRQFYKVHPVLGFLEKLYA